MKQHDTNNHAQLLKAKLESTEIFEISFLVYKYHKKEVATVIECPFHQCL